MDLSRERHRLGRIRDIKLKITELSARFKGRIESRRLGKYVEYGQAVNLVSSVLGMPDLSKIAGFFNMGRTEFIPPLVDLRGMRLKAELRASKGEYRVKRTSISPVRFSPWMDDDYDDEE